MKPIKNCLRKGRKRPVVLQFGVSVPNPDIHKNKMRPPKVGAPTKAVASTKALYSEALPSFTTEVILY